MILIHRYGTVRFCPKMNSSKTPLSKQKITRTRQPNFLRSFSKSKSFKIIFKKVCLRKITGNFYFRFFSASSYY